MNSKTLYDEIQEIAKRWGVEIELEKKSVSARNPLTLQELAVADLALVLIHTPLPKPHLKMVVLKDRGGELGGKKAAKKGWDRDAATERLKKFAAKQSADFDSFVKNFDKI